MRKIHIPLLLIFISAIAYLPFIHQFGYYRDDWYLMYSANALGGDVFHQIYASDRPIRAFLMSFVYSIFDLNPLYYNISAYIFRLLGAFAFFYTLQMLWSHQRNANLIASILFLVFPGFLSTPNSIDYQAQQLSLFLAMSSIALSVWAILKHSNIYKFFIAFLVGIMSFIYLGLVEYFLGLEVFRLGVIFLISRSASDSFREQLRKVIPNYLSFSIGTTLFVIWRFFIFDSERKATDLSAQIGNFLHSPLLVGTDWLRTLIKDIFEVTLLSWWIPLSDLWSISLRLRELFVAGLIALLTISLIVFILKNNSSHNEYENQRSWLKEAFWLGLITVISGFVPVILSNRDADFGGLSRYMLASSVGAVILVTVFISQFRSQKVYIGAACILVTSSVLMHYFNGLSWARSAQQMQNFWWQVSWRIPQIKENTTLVVNYSHTAVEEDYFIWGPANLIYHPQSMDSQRVEPAIWGLVLNRESAVSILNHAKPSFVNRRSIITYLGYDNILIITQPSLSSCVLVIDGNMPIVSAYEQYDIQMVASESNQNNILLDVNHAPLSNLVFGSEPPHDWCFYYQTASLAFQRGEYETVLDIKQRAKREGFSAQDPVEWMPFLQSAILLEDYEQANEMARFIKKDSFLQLQVCNFLPQNSAFNEEMKDFIRKTFCIN